MNALPKQVQEVFDAAMTNLSDPSKLRMLAAEFEKQGHTDHSKLLYDRAGGVGTRDCSLCEKPTDTFLRGSALVKLDNVITSGPARHVGIVICSGCVDHLSKRIIQRYRKSEGVTVAEDPNGAWSTATWDSD
jgi:hypothetical protein